MSGKPEKRGEIYMEFSCYKDLKKRCTNQTEHKADNKIRIVVVLSKCSMAVGAGEVLRSVQDAVIKGNIKNVIVEITGCMGMCSQEPMIIVKDENRKQYVYNLVTYDKARVIAISHGLYNKAVSAWLLK